MKIILLGYMASGKSTVGFHLSKALQYQFIDLDSYIESEEGQSIPDIFKTKGEIYFRRQEVIHLRTILSTSTHQVIAVGGGTPCYANNMKTITDNNSTVSFYLKHSINELSTRLLRENSKRPLISHITTPEGMTEFIGKHLFERQQYYTQSDYSIDCDALTIEDIVEQLIAKLF